MTDLDKLIKILQAFGYENNQLLQGVYGFDYKLTTRGNRQELTIGCGGGYAAMYVVCCFDLTGKAILKDFGIWE